MDATRTAGRLDALGCRPLSSWLLLRFVAGREMPISLSAGEREQFAKDGFLLRHGFYSPAEIELLSRVSRRDAPRSDGGRGGSAKSEGRQSEFWMVGGSPDERGIINAVCFGERMVSAISALLDDEVTLYHRCARLRSFQHRARPVDTLEPHWSWGHLLQKASDEG